MNIPIITVTNQPERAKTLVDSANKNGWVIHVVEMEWRGFGTKLIATYNYLKEHPEIEQFVFADAHDVVVLASPIDFSCKINTSMELYLSAERGLWPPYLIPFREQYPKTPQRFDYVNSGLYYAKAKTFIKFYEKYPPFYEIDDQYWLNMVYLLELRAGMYMVDHFQSVFNSHSFIDEGEYTYHNEIERIEIMGNFPIFIHKNGGTIDEKLNQMLGI